MKEFVQIWHQHSDIHKNRQINLLVFYSPPNCSPQQTARDSKTSCSHPSSVLFESFHPVCSGSHPLYFPRDLTLPTNLYLYPLSILSCSFCLMCATGLSYRPFTHAQVSPNWKQGIKPRVSLPFFPTFPFTAKLPSSIVSAAPSLYAHQCRLCHTGRIIPTFSLLFKLLPRKYSCHEWTECLFLLQVHMLKKDKNKKDNKKKKKTKKFLCWNPRCDGIRRWGLGR